MANLSPEEQFELTKKSVQKSVEDYFPIVGNQHTIRLNNAEFRDNLTPNDIHGQKRARLNRQTWGVPLVGQLELVDNSSGDVLQTKQMNLLRLPKITREYTYIVRGQGRTVQNQFRLKSGVYAKRRQNGQLTSQFNLRKGVGFRLDLHDRGHMMLSYPTGGGSRKNIRLYPVLRAMGVSDQQLEQAWGADTLQINKAELKKKDEGSKDINKLYEALYRRKAPNIGDAVQGIQDAFADTELYADTTRKTLGQPFSKVNGQCLTAAARKLYRIAREEDDVDNLEDLGFKEVWSVEDHLAEKIRNSRRELMRRVNNNLDKTTDISKVITPGTFNLPIKAFFTQDSRTLMGDQTNPLTMVADHRQTTLMGTGGITTEDQIVTENTLIDKTHLGYLDPMHTPESKKTGVVQHLPMGVVKKDHNILAPVWNTQKGKMELVDPIKLHTDTKVGFPDQYSWRGGKPIPNGSRVWASVGGERTKVKAGDVNYILPSTGALLGPISSTVPFINHNHGARVMMADRQLSQAIPVVNNEAPLVQTAGVGDKTMEDVFGTFAAHAAPVAGTVTSVGKDTITIQDANKKNHTVQLYNNYPLNNAKVGTFYHSSPLVKKGDEVKKDQIIADTNYTRNGQLAIGTNLITAFMPSGGENFEDGVVISQSAANKMTSPHLYRYTVELDANTQLNKKDYLRHYKDALTREQMDKLDDGGVVRIGQKLEPGDTIMASLRKASVNASTEALRKMKKVLFKPYDDAAQVWDRSVGGEVVDVVRKGKFVTVFVRANEPMREGDKLAGRHGNKGIVVRIRPDDEMPKTKDGKAVEVLMNPTTVPTRINLGQVMEVGASRLAQKTGDRYVAPSFHGSGDRSELLRNQLKRHGISPTEELFTPDGKSLGQVGVGPQYIVKLHQQVEKKNAVRGRSAYDINQAPKRGGKTGAQKMDQYGNYALLAHGARNLLREKHTYTSSRNDRLWEAIESGMPIPPPQQTFAFSKFQGYLNGLGLNLQKRGHSLKMVPFTDQQIRRMSSGEIQKPWLQLFGDKEEVGGLFDRHVTGGISGTKWGHFSLAEPVLNPLFFKGVAALTGLSRKDVISVSVGEKGLLNGEVVDPTTKGATIGGQALYDQLQGINVPSALKDAQEQLNKTAKKSPARANLRKKVKYLRALQSENLDPTVYMLKTVPVMPPQFRPVLATDDNSPFRSSLNGLYKYVGMTNYHLKHIDPLMPAEDKVKLRRALLGQVWKLYGAEQRPYKSDRSIIPRENEDTLGILELISGKRPKEGFMQDRLISKRQDLSMRSTITVGSDLDMDEVGLPRKQALKLFEPFVKAELKKRGLARKAQDLIDGGDKQAFKALEHVLRRTNNQGQEEFHPVVLKRDPALHAFSTMAYKPVLVEGDAIRLHPLSCEGFNADFDGDQMAAFVPVTPSAIEDAKRMLPSQKLFSTTYGTPMHTPTQEAIWGLYQTSRWGNETSKKFKTRGEALAAHKNGKVGMNDVIRVGGMRTTPGRMIIDNMLPSALQGGDHLTDPKFIMNKKRMRSMLTTVARNHPNDYPTTVQAMLRHGNRTSYQTGSTISLNDLRAVKDVRDPILQKAHSEAAAIRKKRLSVDEKRARVIDVYNRATDELLNGMRASLGRTNNSIFHMHSSGARGSAAQMRQMLAAPMLVQDGFSRTREIPVTTSYAEGLDFGSFWETQHGARKGIVQRASGTSEPGAMSKKVINTTMHYMITDQDCGTEEGLRMRADDDRAIGRVLAKPLSIGKSTYSAGTLFDDRLRKEITKNRKEVPKLILRSPLKCEQHDGLCSKCFGQNEEGRLHQPGVNIGVIAGQAVGEPLSQGSMNAFHEGGVAKGAGAKSVSQFERATQLIQFNERIPNSTTLAQRGGKITAVDRDPTGGFKVKVGDRVHKVTQRPNVKVGDSVERGQPLSPGVINPHEMMQVHGPHRGIRKVRAYVTDELTNLFRMNPYGQKNVEVVVRALTDLAEVDEPGTAPGVDRGDLMSSAAINSLNKEHNAGIRATPVLRGANVLPLAQTEDFLARSNYERLKGTFTDAALGGWESKLHGTHPIPGLVWGTEFGKGTKEKPWLY